MPAPTITGRGSRPCWRRYLEPRQRGAEAGKTRIDPGSDGRGKRPGARRHRTIDKPLATALLGLTRAASAYSGEA